MKALTVPAILLSQMEPAPEWEADFHDWYDREHVPSRLAVPGFTGANRYVVVQGAPKYGVVYEMESLAALETPAYRALKRQPSERTAAMLRSVRGFARYTCERIGVHVNPAAPADYVNSPYLFAVLFAVPPEREEAFNTWYDDDHSPLLLRHPRWWAVRRFKVREGEPGPFTHLALHHLGGLDALSSPEREAARNTPMRAKLAAEPWFKGEYIVYRRLAPAW